MVFIEERNQFLASISGQPKQLALFNLLTKLPLEILSEDISETDAIYYSCIQAINDNNKVGFEKQYNLISQRKISKGTNAPFIHDDFLIFILIIGVSKFDCAKEWIEGVTKNRTQNATTITFINLLRGNYLSKANIQSLTIAFLFEIDKSKITNGLLNEAYEAVCDLKQSTNNYFIRIVNYRAFDLIIQYKLPRDSDDIARLLEFEKRFKKRINTFSYIAYNGLLLIILFGTYYILHNLPEEWKSKINEVGILIGIGGVGLFGNIIPKWKTKFYTLILRVFGYKQAL